MDALEALFKRRSVRRYTGEPVSDQAMETILRAAMQAPSAVNYQPWHFVVIDDRRLLDRIPDFHPYSSFLREAPVAIVVCGDLERDMLDASYWVQGCSAATENLLLAAHAIGLGAVWMGVYPRKERMEGLRRLLQLPDNLVPLNIVSLGHPAESPVQVDRFDPSRITRNVWPGPWMISAEIGKKEKAGR
jgi:nitroreductase